MAVATRPGYKSRVVRTVSVVVFPDSAFYRLRSSTSWWSACFDPNFSFRIYASIIPQFHLNGA